MRLHTSQRSASPPYSAGAGFPVNQHHEYDVRSLRHQVPGGMMGSLKRQLVDYGMEDRLEEVLTETARVRGELGYPVMATPFSQLVGTQAVLNVVTGSRYGTIPDQVIQYAAEYYGTPVGPIQQDILDRIMSAPRAAEVLAQKPNQPTAEELRKRYDSTDDDEVILPRLSPMLGVLSNRPRKCQEADSSVLNPEWENVR